ncbi:MAG: helix-turn-helix transcriptional regulator [Pseudomonadota bacterium]
MNNEIDSAQIKKNIANLLTNIRNDALKSKMQLARELGITSQQITKYENGKDQISILRLIALCKNLNFSPVQFINTIYTHRNKSIDLITQEFYRMRIEINKHLSNINDIKILRMTRDITKNFSHLYSTTNTNSAIENNSNPTIS